MRCCGRPPGASPPALVAALVLGVGIGLALLWPGGDGLAPPATGIGDVVRADVVGVTTGTCENWGGPGCRLAEIELRSGPSAGRRSTITLPNDRLAPQITAGEHIRVARTVPSGLDPELVERLPIDDPSQQPFAFVDFERSSPLLILVLVFAGLVVLLGGWHGVRALLGLAVSLGIVIEFLAPAIVAGHPPLLVALVGSLAVMVVTVGISHGIGLKSMAAMLGTATALALTAGLALFAVRATDISGFSSEEATLLLSGAGDLSLQGLVVAGMVIGALGVLDDVTVSQASTVLALRRANAALGFRRLFGEALAVGRDHLGRDRQHPRARLRRRRAARAADLQHEPDAVRRGGQPRAGRRADRRDARRVDRPDRRGAADHRGRRAARHPAARGRGPRGPARTRPL